MMNVSSLVHPQPDPGGDAVRATHLRWAAVLQGDEGAELPGHRPAHGGGDGVAAGRRTGATGNRRRRARSKNSIAHAAGPQAHLRPRCRTAPSRSPPNSAWRKPVQEAVDDVRSLPSRACAADLPGRPARSDRSPRWNSRPSRCWPSRSPRRRWTTRRCPGSSTTTSSSKAAGGARAWARSTASGGVTRSEIRVDARPGAAAGPGSVQRQPTSRASCGWCRPRARAAAPAWAAAEQLRGLRTIATVQHGARDRRHCDIALAGGRTHPPERRRRA